MAGYIEPKASRHRAIFVDGVETLRIPPRRQWFAIAFLPIWLIGWTIGGMHAIRQMLEQFDPFLIVGLCGWAVGWVFAASTLAMQVAGAETIRVVRGDLEIANGVGPLRRVWRYRGHAIRDVSSATPASGFWGQSRGFDNLFFLRPSSGAVRFSYGAETVHLAASVDESEGRIIADWMTRRLPKSAASST